jgi:hypothetical protein
MPQKITVGWLQDNGWADLFVEESEERVGEIDYNDGTIVIIGQLKEIVEQQFVGFAVYTCSQP